ncbi:MAG: FecR domain-containing protein [Bacteroidota bacterium]
MKEEYWNTLIQKHLDGNCSAAERSELDAWRAESAANRQHYEQIAAIDRELRQLDASWLQGRDADWKALADRLQSPAASEAKVKPLGRQRRQWLRIAASLLAIAATGWLLWSYVDSSDTTEAIAQEFRSEQNTRSILLPDSTEVLLNRSSTLRLLADFNEADRRVALEGEAFFKVHQDAQRPFLIDGGGAQVRVLGTAFNLRAYAEEEQIELSVEEGRVRFSEDGGPQSMELSAQMAAVYDRKERQLRSQDYEPSLTAAWQPRALVFDNTPFKTVLLSLERRYNIQFDDQTGDFNEPLRSTFTPETPLRQVFDQLSLLYQLEFSSKKDKIVVSR